MVAKEASSYKPITLGGMGCCRRIKDKESLKGWW